jgi:hypothetical protein
MWLKKQPLSYFNTKHYEKINRIIRFYTISNNINFLYR